MGSERGWSPCPSSGAGSRSIPAVAGSIADMAALPLARLDGTTDRQDRLCSPRWACGMASLLLPMPPYSTCVPGFSLPGGRSHGGIPPLSSSAGKAFSVSSS